MNQLSSLCRLLAIMIQSESTIAGLFMIMVQFYVSTPSYLNVSSDLIATYYRGGFDKGKTPPRPLIEDLFDAPCYSKEHQRLNFHYDGTVNFTADGLPCLDKFGSSVRCQTFDKFLGTGCQMGTSKNSFKYCNVCKHNWRGYNACKLPKAGTLYKGDVNVTITGRPCMSWDKAVMLSKKIQDKYLTITASTFPDESIVGLTKCRNPTPYSRDGPWCYFANSLPVDVFKWEYCDPCANDPGLQILEKDTRGELNRSVLLRVPHIHSCMAFCAVHLECQKASFFRKRCYIYSPKGHINIFKAIVTFSYNKQNGTVSRPLTLRTDQDEMTLRTALWIPNLLPMEGMTYSGSRNVTKNGWPCLPWSLFKIRGDYVGRDFPEQSVSEASNYCRQTGKYTGGPYCHVDAYDVQHVKSCDVITDNPRLYKLCALPKNGHLYRGSKSVTVTGRKCMTWVEAASLSKYLSHLYENIPNKAFPGSHSNKKHAANFCRNPTPQTRFGPWCFIEYKEHGKQIHSWEYCDVCSKTKPVAELEIGYVKDLEAVRDILYLDYGTSSEYECQYLCSVLAHCSAVIFVLKENRCHVGWRKIVKDMSGLSSNPIPGADLIYIFRKPCIVREQDSSKSIRQWCYIGETCYFSDKIEYVTEVKEIGQGLCAKHCLESISCLQYMLVGRHCYVYKRDVCSCYSEVNVARKVVIMVTRCYEYASDEVYFENDAAYNTFEAEDYHIYQQSALSWVPEEDNGSLVKEKELIEVAERKKDMGNLDEEGVSPSYIGYILKIVMVVWTMLIAIITFITCFIYIPYF